MTKLYKSALGIAALALAFTACTDDWDDHYDVPATTSASLWETISANSELTNFAKVVQACGYDSTLVGQQVFTVFAPTNASFSAAQADSVIALYRSEKAAGSKDKDNAAVKEFLQNHIALYNYSVSSSSNDSIVMMNGKYQVLASGTFGGETIASANQACANGVLFTLNHKVDYFPNIFEYLAKDADLDSVASFLYSYNKYEFDAASSVAGDIVNGKTVYLDSVVNLQNVLFYDLGRINSEDSTYWMVAPTNEVWNKLVPEYEQYFQYDGSVNKRDSLQFTLARVALLEGTVFSRTYTNSDAALRDSAMSVNAIPYSRRYYYYGTYDDKYYQYDKPLEPGGVMYNTVNEACSNGQVMKASEWNFDKRSTFFQTVRAQGESSSRLDSVDRQSTNTPTIVTVQSTNPFYNKISRNSFATILPAGASSNTLAVYNVPSLLSNIDYDVYIITAPALAEDTLATATDRLPTKFRVRMSYNDANGQPISSRNWQTLATTLTTTADQVDTFKVASNVRLPYCSLGSNVDAQVKIILDTRVSNTEVRRGTFNRQLRLDCIIFKPHED